MIHSQETIDRIKELLIISGVQEGDNLEEMVDHYLSEIETQTDNHINTQQAIRTCYQNIATTDFSYLKEERRINKGLLAIGAIVLILSFVLMQSYNTSPNQLSESAFAENISAPQGWPLEEPLAPITSKFGMLFGHQLLLTIGICLPVLD